MAFGAALRDAVNRDPDRFDRVQILKETHDPVMAAARAVIAGWARREGLTCCGSDYWAADASGRCMPARSRRWTRRASWRWPTRCRRQRRRWPRGRAEVRTTEAILDAHDIDAVVIGTPTDTHFDLIHGAARAGKAIFCEKPIDMSVDNIRACIEAWRRRACPS
jgi:hypothetical protein